MLLPWPWENTMTEDRVIWRRDLRAALGDISDETLRRLMKSGKLPKPDVDLSNRTRGWRLSTLRSSGFNIVTSDDATSTPPARMPVESATQRSAPDIPPLPRHILRETRRAMTGMRTKPGILTDEQVAALLDCEVSVVQSMARTAELPGLKIGRPWLFPREALMTRLNEMALKGGRINPTPRKFMPLSAKRIRELWREANASTAEVAVTFARLLEEEHGIIARATGANAA
jgi:excisionase family DNA binding protein